MNPIRFSIEVYVVEDSDDVTKGNHTLERVMTGLSFLPSINTKILSLTGFDDVDITPIVCSVPSLYCDGYNGYEWIVELHDSVLGLEDQVPEVTIKQLKEALDKGWELSL